MYFLILILFYCQSHTLYDIYAFFWSRNQQYFSMSSWSSARTYKRNARIGYACAKEERGITCQWLSRIVCQITPSLIGACIFERTSGAQMLYAKIKAKQCKSAGVINRRHAERWFFSQYVRIKKNGHYTAGIPVPSLGKSWRERSIQWTIVSRKVICLSSFNLHKIFRIVELLILRSLYY